MSTVPYWLLPFNSEGIAHDGSSECSPSSNEAKLTWTLALGLREWPG